MDDNFFLELRKTLVSKPSSPFTRFFIKLIDEYCLKNATSSSYSNPQEVPQSIPQEVPQSVPQPETQVDEPKKKEKKEYTKSEIEAFHQSMPAAKLIVEDVFTITGKGTVVTGIAKKTIKLNDSIRIYNPSGEYIFAHVTGIEKFREVFEEAQPGENVGLIIRGVSREDISRYDVIV